MPARIYTSTIAEKGNGFGWSPVSRNTMIVPADSSEPAALMISMRPTLVTPRIPGSARCRQQSGWPRISTGARECVTRTRDARPLESDQGWDVLTGGRVGVRHSGQDQADSFDPLTGLGNRRHFLELV